MSALPNEKWMNEADRVAAQHKLSEMFFQVAWPTDEDNKDAWPPETTDMQVRPQATSICGLKLLVYGALSYQTARTLGPLRPPTCR
jgi:hypothetical protein